MSGSPFFAIRAGGRLFQPQPSRQAIIVLKITRRNIAAHATNAYPTSRFVL